MLTFTVDTTDRLDKFLASKLEVSRSQIQKAIKQGVVLVNGQIESEKDSHLSVGDKIELPEFKLEELQQLDLDLNVVFENDDLAVIDKPAGLVMHPGAGHKQDTLANALLHRFPGVEKVGDPHRPGIVHRLDEATSGLIVIAKTPGGFDYLKRLFLEKKIEKQYIALAHGVPDKLHGVIDVPIAKQSTRQKMKAGIGKEAVTEYSVLATGHLKSAIAQNRRHNEEPESKADESADYTGKEQSLQYSLLRVKLHTGRTHQIRVHLAHIGLPVVGDQLYGGQFKKSDLSLLNRQFLHAFKLKFQLPDDTWLELESELPEDLKQVLIKLGIRVTLSQPVT